MSVTVIETRDLGPCHALRRAVFVEEQQVPADLEWDGRDQEARHLLALDGDEPLGTARFFISAGTASIGRVCVARAARGRGIGLALMREALRLLRADPQVSRITLSAQAPVIGFYESLGFAAHGPTYMDAGIPHRSMEMACAAP